MENKIKLKLLKAMRDGYISYEDATKVLMFKTKKQLTYLMNAINELYNEDKVMPVTVVGCVSSDTYVLDKEKGICKIIDLIPKGVDKYKQGLYELNNKVLDSYNNFAQNTKFWVNGLCHTNKVILDNNYSIIGSYYSCPYIVFPLLYDVFPLLSEQY